MSFKSICDYYQVVVNLHSQGRDPARRISQILQREQPFKSCVSCWELTKVDRIEYRQHVVAHPGCEWVLEHIGNNHTHNLTLYVHTSVLHNVIEGLKQYGQKIWNLHYRPIHRHHNHVEMPFQVKELVLGSVGFQIHKKHE